MTIGQRIEDRLAQARMSQSELARRVGLKQTTINSIIRGSGGTKHLHTIARELATTPAYLTGETDDPSEGAIPEPTSRQVAERLDSVLVPHLALRYSMGGGSIIEDPVVIDHIPFPREWLRARIEGAFEDVMLITGEGESMVPTIHPGDIVLIDRAQRKVRLQDQIWAIGMHEVGMVKRLRKRKGGYQILSDNPVVPPDHATDGEMEIVGRVIATLRWT